MLEANKFSLRFLNRFQQVFRLETGLHEFFLLDGLVLIVIFICVGEACLPDLEPIVESRAALVEVLFLKKVVVGFALGCSIHLLEPTKQVNFILLLNRGLCEFAAVQTAGARCVS